MKLKYTLCAFALATHILSAQNKKPEAESKNQLVDAELLLLVEVPQSLQKDDFGSFMSQYSESFQSNSFLEALSNGQYKSIAASLMFYGDTDQQTTALGWTPITGKESAINFSNAIAKVDYPFDATSTSTSNALSAAHKSFSINSPNGFESVAKIVDIVAFNASTPLEQKKEDDSKITVADIDSQQRDTLLANGVSSINGLAIISEGDHEDTYKHLKENVVAGSKFFLTSAKPNDFGSKQTDKLVYELTNAAAPVPEPSSVALLGLGMCSLLIRRKR